MAFYHPSSKITGNRESELKHGKQNFVVGLLFEVMYRIFHPFLAASFPVTSTSSHPSPAVQNIKRKRKKLIVTPRLMAA